MTRLSPIGNSKRDEKVKYIDGQLADDKGSVKVVSFLQSLRQATYDSLTKISLVDCEVKVKVKEACDDALLDIVYWKIIRKSVKCDDNISVNMDVFQHAILIMSSCSNFLKV